MNKDELSNAKEHVGQDFIEIARRLVPQGINQEFYQGYSAGMKDAVRVINQFKEGGILNAEQLSVLTEAFSAFFIVASEKVLDNLPKDQDLS